MTTLGTLRNRIGRLLGDSALTGYTADLITDAICAALDAILPWIPKESMYAIPDGEGLTTFALPGDLYELETVIDGSTGEILARSNLIPGHTRGEYIEATNDWIEYPHGSVTFSKPLTNNNTYTIYYTAYWSKPTPSTSMDEILEPPDYTIVGLSLYAAAYALLPSAVSASEVRQFNTRTDSGAPEQNPMQKTSNYLLQLFANEMNRHPKHQRAQR